MCYTIFHSPLCFLYTFRQFLISLLDGCVSTCAHILAIFLLREKEVLHGKPGMLPIIRGYHLTKTTRAKHTPTNEHQVLQRSESTKHRIIKQGKRKELHLLKICILILQISAITKDRTIHELRVPKFYAMTTNLPLKNPTCHA